jgi:hypothetical protein
MTAENENPAADQPAVEQPAAEPAFKPHTDTPSLLETLKAPGSEQPATETTEAKPVEGAAVEAAVVEKTGAEAEKPVESDSKPVDLAAAEPISYPEWTFPEGVTADKGKVEAFNQTLAEANIPAEAAQKLFDLHTTAAAEYRDFLEKDQHRVFGEARAEWAKQAMADPEIGGSRWNTSQAAIARVRDALMSSHKPGTPGYAADEAAFNGFLAATGAGDHPIFLKFVHRAARFMDEPQATSLPANIGATKNGGMPQKNGMARIYKDPPGPNGQEL